MHGCTYSLDIDCCYYLIFSIICSASIASCFLQDRLQHFTLFNCFYDLFLLYNLKAWVHLFNSFGQDLQYSHSHWDNKTIFQYLIEAYAISFSHKLLIFIIFFTRLFIFEQNIDKMILIFTGSPLYFYNITHSTFEWEMPWPYTILALCQHCSCMQFFYFWFLWVVMLLMFLCHWKVYLIS